MYKIYFKLIYINLFYKLVLCSYPLNIKHNNVEIKDKISHLKYIAV
jgi:hypothetical protein